MDESKLRDRIQICKLSFSFRINSFMVFPGTAFPPGLPPGLPPELIGLPAEYLDDRPSDPDNTESPECASTVPRSLRTLVTELSDNSEWSPYDRPCGYHRSFR